jgi:hypothetical protein
VWASRPDPDSYQSVRVRAPGGGQLWAGPSGRGARMALDDSHGRLDFTDRFPATLAGYENHDTASLRGGASMRRRRTFGAVLFVLYIIIGVVVAA